MTYWHYVEIATGMEGKYHWALVGAVVPSLVLGAIYPQARSRLRGVLVLTILSVLGTLICGAALAGGWTETAAGYRWLHFLSQMLIAAAMINLAGVLIFRVLCAAVHVKPAPILHDTLLGIAYVVTALMLLGRHGVDLSGIIATSAVVTAIIGFSLQDTLGNVMGGVALQLERSIGVGDWIRVGDVEGEVRQIRWRQTSVETRNWDTVVIPNSLLMKSSVTVLGRRDGKPRLHRMWVYFNVDYRHPPAEVIDAVERAMQAEPIPDVAADPPPNCILKEFDKSYGHYAVRYWLVNFAKDDPTSSEVRTRVFVALQRAGMNLSIPAQSVFMTLEGRARAQRKLQEEREHRVAALANVGLFKPLTDAERDRMAEELTVAPFRRGEAITRQGNQAHYLYIITKGDAEVTIAVGDDHRVLRTLHVGDIFGEMGMMTGEPRTATVTAITDVVCYRLDKSAFTGTLQRRPEVADAISHLLAKRKLELDAMHEGLTADAVRHRMAPTQEDLLHKIRRFFTLG